MAAPTDRAAGTRRPHRPRQAHRERAGALHRVSPSARCRATSASTTCASSIDCANGAGYQVAPDALWELGAEVIKIGVEPNGHNINLKCGSTSPEALCDKVREMRADIGIALDGDADRVVIVDEKGQHRRRRPDHGRDRRELAPARQADGRRRRGHRHVQPGARALPEGASASPWCARPSATATSSSTCASTATTSAASSRATSCCPTSPPPATGWSRRCRCCRSWSAPASR